MQPLNSYTDLFKFIITQCQSIYMHICAFIMSMCEIDHVTIDLKSSV